MIHLLVTVPDDTLHVEVMVSDDTGPSSVATHEQVQIRELTEDQRFVTKSALRFYGRKQDKNREDLTRKGRPTVEVDQRIANIDAAYDVIGWDEPDDGESEVQG